MPCGVETLGAYTLPSPGFAITGCSDWVNNTAAEGSYGTALASSAHELSSNPETQLSVWNFTSGSDLQLAFQLYDAFGTAMSRGSADSNNTLITVSASPAPYYWMLLSQMGGVPPCMRIC